MPRYACEGTFRADSFTHRLHEEFAETFTVRLRPCTLRRAETFTNCLQCLRRVWAPVWVWLTRLLFVWLMRLLSLHCGDPLHCVKHRNPRKLSQNGLGRLFGGFFQVVKKLSKNDPRMVPGKPPTLRNGQKMIEKWSQGGLRPFGELFSIISRPFSFK